MAARPGLRPLLRLRRRNRPVPPELVRDNSQIDPPRSPDDGYHVSEDLVDQLLQMINDSKGVRPDRPFFAYVPFGATHAPHQAPASYLEKYRGRYDEGWDVVRERWYQRQLELGVIPRAPSSLLATPALRHGTTCRKRTNCWRVACKKRSRLLDHTDDQIGRLIDGLRAMGQLDNTIVVLLADNGVPGGWPPRCDARDEVLQRNHRITRRGGRADR